MSQNLFIGPYKEGLERDVQPWLLPNDAFPDIEDAHLIHGRAEKKQGYSVLGRLQRTPAVLPEVLGNVGIGTFTFAFVIANVPVSPRTVRVIRLAIPVWGNFDFTDNGNGTLTATVVPAGMLWGYGDIEYEAGAVNLYWDAALPAATPATITDYRHLDRQPTMGLAARELNTLNRIETVAFDQNHSYTYNGATEQFDEIATGAWTSTDSDFMWTTNYWYLAALPLLWVTNNIAYDAAGNDGIKYYNGATWVNLPAPVNVAGTAFLRGALMVIPFRDRMVSLNTLEGAAPAAAAVRFPQRARWSAKADPTSIAAPNNWDSDTPGLGGYYDAPTTEDIVSCWYTKDVLIVFFEKSTWQLAFTGSELAPFYWKKLNSELGAISTFSAIGFDKGIMAIGNHGIVVSDSINVERIDEKIPNLAVSIEQENDGPTRVHGIRDFENKMSYWTMPTHTANRIFPNEVLALNYEEQSYSTYIDTFTCFGDYQADEDYSWDSINKSWEAADVPWLAPGQQAFFPSIIAGNQQSFVLLLKQGASNSICMDIVNGITAALPPVVGIPNHNLDTGQFVKIYDTFGFAVNVAGEALGVAPIGAIAFNANLANLGMMPTSLVVNDGANDFQDGGDGVLIDEAATGITGTIDYVSGSVGLVFPAALAAPLTITATYNYNDLNYRIFYVNVIDANTFSLFNVLADESLDPVDLTAFAAYAGAGSVEIVYNVNLKTKKFSPFVQEGRSFRLNYLDVFMNTNDGNFKISVFEDHLPSSIIDLQATSLDDSGKASGKHWNRYYPNTDSNFIQLQFKLSNYEMTIQENAYSDFVLHAMNLNIKPTGRILS